tara:strand:+ start:554 stop:907 length:354 start_codon:yes stop_codon:yes gene_type:complete
LRCPPDKPVAKDAWRRAAHAVVDSYEAFGCRIAPREPLAPLLKNPRDTPYGRQIHMSVHAQKDEVRVEILCSELRACEELRERERAERERVAERAHRVRTEKVVSGLVGLCMAQRRV